MGHRVIGSRITSYNVCYTKLLRLKRLLPNLGPKPELTPEQEARLAAWRALPTTTTRVPMEQSRLVVVDVETSGLNISKRNNFV